MNLDVLVRPLSEILPLMGVAYATTAPPFWVPFSPVAYCGVS